MELTRHGANDPALADILALVRTTFAYMDGLIDPPSSTHRLTLDAVQEQTLTGEIWSLGPPPVACLFLTPLPDALYLGKLCVAEAFRGTGLGRALVDQAARRARALNLPRLELQSRIELGDNHAAFRAMGFAEIARTAHPGYANPTSLTFSKRL